MSWAGLTADARVLIDKARVECQSHRLTVEDPVTIEYITRHIAGIQQRYTQSGGVRPFGISCLIIGFDPNDNQPRLYMTEPSGIYSAWKANAIGRSSKTVREFLEKHWKADMDTKDTVKTAVKSLLEVVQTGAKNIDLAIVDGFGQIRNLTLQEIEEVVKELEVEKVRSCGWPSFCCGPHADFVHLFPTHKHRKQRQNGSEVGWRVSERPKRACSAPLAKCPGLTWRWVHRSDQTWIEIACSNDKSVCVCNRLDELLGSHFFHEEL